MAVVVSVVVAVVDRVVRRGRRCRCHCLIVPCGVVVLLMGWYAAYAASALCPSPMHGPPGQAGTTPSAAKTGRVTVQPLDEVVLPLNHTAGAMEPTENGKQREVARTCVGVRVADLRARRTSLRSSTISKTHPNLMYASVEPQRMTQRNAVIWCPTQQGRSQRLGRTHPQ